MIVKHYAQGKFYRIACPEGSQIIRRSDRITPDGGFLHDQVIVPFEGKEIPIPPNRRVCCRCWPNRVGAGCPWSASQNPR
jgi:hypothetical protein